MTDIEKLQKQHNLFQSTLWEVSSIIGFKPGENPTRVQLIARLKARVAPYNEKHGVSSAVATAVAIPAVYKPTPPAYSPNTAPLSKKATPVPVQMKRKTPPAAGPPVAPLPEPKRPKAETPDLAASLKGLLDGIATTEPF